MVVLRLVVVAVLGVALPAQKPVVSLRVPLPHGTRCQVTRGNGEGTHQDVYNRYAIDFGLPVGSPIHAASAGRVVYVRQNTSGPTGNWQDNNEIAVRLSSGHVVIYLHLKKDGARVKVGEQVLPGDLIGLSGNTGKSTSPHLHIDVRRGHRLGPSVPWDFASVGVPAKGQSVLSRNYPVREFVAPLEELRELYAFSQRVDAREVLTRELGKLLRPASRSRTAKKLAKIKGRKDLVKQFLDHRERVVEPHRRDRAATLKSLAAAEAKGDVAAVVRLALSGERNFAGLGKLREFRNALRAAKRHLEFKEAAAAARAQRRRSAPLLAAVKAELEARSRSWRNQEPDWKSVRTRYEKAAAQTNDPDVRATLRARAASVGQERRAP